MGDIFEKCLACGSCSIEMISYGNHLEKVDLFFLKHWVLDKLMSAAGVFGNRLAKYEHVRLFSPLFKIARCRECGYGCYTKRITERELSDYYGQSYWGNTIAWGHTITEEERKFPDSRALKQYEFVKNYLPRKKLRVLDIGAGNASTVRLVRQKHPYPVELNVVEPGEKWSDLYKEESIEKVADFFPTKLDNRYDYIHTSHWLEHVLDPNKVIVSLNEALKKEGRVFVEVPNCDADYFRLTSRDIPHIHFFTIESLPMFFQDRGFKVIEVGEFGLTNKVRWNNEPGNNDEMVTRLMPNPGGCWLRGIFEKK